MSNLVDKKIVYSFSITFLLIGFAFGFGVAKLTDKKSDTNVGEQVVNAFEEQAKKESKKNYEIQMRNDSIRMWEKFIKEDEKVLNDSSKSEKDKKLAKENIEYTKKHIVKLKAEIEEIKKK